MTFPFPTIPPSSYGPLSVSVGDYDSSGTNLSASASRTITSLGIGSSANAYKRTIAVFVMFGLNTLDVIDPTTEVSLTLGGQSPIGFSSYVQILSSDATDGNCRTWSFWAYFNGSSLGTAEDFVIQNGSTRILWTCVVSYEILNGEIFGVHTAADNTASSPSGCSLTATNASDDVLIGGTTLYSPFGGSFTGLTLEVGLTQQSNVSTTYDVRTYTGLNTAPSANQSVSANVSGGEARNSLIVVVVRQAR